jgi:High potential iron-sulfur protein
MNRTIRRRAVIQLACGAVLPARAQVAHVDEASETAVALGYRHDASQVDTNKHPGRGTGQHCANCIFWQGAAADPWGGCSMFGRKQVANAGWCVAWRKP